MLKIYLVLVKTHEFISRKYMKGEI